MKAESNLVFVSGVDLAKPYALALNTHKDYIISSSPNSITKRQLKSK